MGDGRIKVAKDKAKLVKTLKSGNDTIGLFQSYADVLIFAASIGIEKQLRKPITEYSEEIDPIRKDIFYGKGYDQTINLIALIDNNNTILLASDSDSEEKRIKIFEEYANAGLELLQEKILAGSTNYTESILLYLSNIYKVNFDNYDEFNLEDFL